MFVLKLLSNLFSHCTKWGRETEQSALEETTAEKYQMKKRKKNQIMRGGISKGHTFLQYLFWMICSSSSKPFTQQLGFSPRRTQVLWPGWPAHHTVNRSVHPLPPKPPCSPAQLAIFISRIACELRAYYQGFPSAHRSNAKDFFLFNCGMGSTYCPTCNTLHSVRDLSNKRDLCFP